MNHPRHPRFISARTAIGIFTAALLLCSCSLTGRSASLSSSTEPSAGAITVLTIGTADSGGSMYPAGEAIAEAIETTSHHIHVNICASNGSYTNIQMLSDGQIIWALSAVMRPMRPFMELTNFQLTLRQDFELSELSIPVFPTGWL